MKYIKTFENKVNIFPKGIDLLSDIILTYLNKLGIKYELYKINKDILKCTIEHKHKVVLMYLYKSGFVAYNEIYDDDNMDDIVIIAYDMNKLTYYLAKSYGIDTGKAILKINT